MQRDPWVLVSACLAGVPCRYDGRDAVTARVRDLAQHGEAVPLCPEVLGGMPTPRPIAACVGGDGAAVWQGAARVRSNEGADVTEAFCAGARAVLAEARRLGIRRAILKERSPSCGVREVWVDGRVVAGMGVTAALLKAEGIKVISEEAFSSQQSAVSFKG
ncbi:MAG: DUF523 domain-containing protein [Nitrospirae bacterium]|nr:DUF523 domain-containing protein [Nitrospirota bacterium]